MRALVLLMMCACASGPATKGPEVRPIDEDQLALLPAGADAVIDVDMEQVRLWAPARRLFSLLPAEARASIEQLGVDPWMDLDGIVMSMSGIGTDQAASTILLRGDFDDGKLERAFGAKFGDYRRARILESGPRSLARLSPRMVVLGSPADVRRVVDLVRGEGESIRSADHNLELALGRAPSAKMGRPAMIAGVVPSDAMRERLRAGELPGAEYDWLTFVLALGDGFDFEIIGKAKSMNAAAGLAAGAKATLDQFRARPLVRLLGIGQYLQDIVVVDRADEVRMVYRLPGRRLDRMLAQLEQLQGMRK